ncbi:MAG TPA: hybrid sensor histidine kinase/response regulator [Gemmataceae bacterium]|jgi:signal transduction histidine kinase|nr:hybrid sensor histidine kinase/response regulator [Gemmataceae bacterium]
MGTRIKHLRAESHVTIGDLIERKADALIARWAERAREEQPNAERVHHDVLIDHLPAFLAKLGRSLATAGDDLSDARSEAVEHGDQRWENGWSITEVVRDYQILRVVLCEFLEEAMSRRLAARESLVLNVAIDDAISVAVAAFADSQASPGGEATNRTEALDLLLNVLGVVGHELRNPLAPLANSLEILRLSGNDPARLETTRQMMGRQLQVLGRLIDDLMDLPRLARGKVVLRRERIDLVRLVRGCAEDRRRILEGAGLQLEVALPDRPVWVIGDETRLIQVFGNLLGNAQKFTDRGGAVTVRMEMPGRDKQAVVTVQDTGIGIEHAMLSKVFEAYTQADRSLDRSRGGLGLGLALVKGVVDLHGGKVVASSAGPGAGATFEVQLPVCPESALQAVGHTEDGAPPVKSRRVLVIEDNPDSAESLKYYLELHGHSVTVALSGPDGVAAAEANAPEVVICDVGLPGMDGYAVATALRGLASPPALIIAVSGHGARKGPRGEPDELFDYYLLKPAEPSRVARLLAVDFPEGPNDSE